MAELQLLAHASGERTALYSNESQLRAALKRVLFKASKALKVPVREWIEPLPLTSTDLERLQALFGRPKFFVIGYPRSGTTLLARLLALHPEVHCNWQAHFFSQAASLSSILLNPDLAAWTARGNNHWCDSSTSCSAIFRAACDFVMESQAAEVGKAIVGDKSPDEAWSSNLSALHAIYPDALVVNIVRDGRDVVLSRRVQQLVDLPGNLSSGGRRLLRNLRKGKRIPDQAGLFTEKWMAREASRWNREVLDTDRIARDLFGPRYRALTYEALLDPPFEELQVIWGHLGARPEKVARQEIEAELADNPAADWHGQKAPELTRQIPRGQAGGWRSMFRAEDRSEFLEQAAPGLEAWGYDTES